MIEPVPVLTPVPSINTSTSISTNTIGFLVVVDIAIFIIIANEFESDSVSDLATEVLLSLLVPLSLLMLLDLLNAVDCSLIVLDRSMFCLDSLFWKIASKYLLFFEASKLFISRYNTSRFLDNSYFQLEVPCTLPGFNSKILGDMILQYSSMENIR